MMCPIPSEIFTMVIRPFDMLFTILGQLIVAMILPEATQIALQNIGVKFCIILLCVAVMCGILVYFFLPKACRL
jgi:hypothetical protein